MQTINVNVPETLKSLMSVEDRGYNPYLAVATGVTADFVYLGSTKAGALQALLGHASTQLASFSPEDFQQLPGLLKESSSGQNDTLVHFHDILYLPSGPAGCPDIIPRYSPEMQLSFLLGVLCSGRSVVFCTDLRYNMNVSGRPILGATPFSGGRPIQEDVIEQADAALLRANIQQLAVYAGGTALECYCLKVHGYTFCKLGDGKLVARPPQQAITVSASAFDLVHRRITKDKNTQRADSNLVKQALVQSLEEACLSPVMSLELSQLVQQELSKAYRK